VGRNQPLIGAGNIGRCAAGFPIIKLAEQNRQLGLVVHFVGVEVNLGVGREGGAIRASPFLRRYRVGWIFQGFRRA
jgi:hypothetical protein